MVAPISGNSCAPKAERNADQSYLVEVVSGIQTETVNCVSRWRAYLIASVLALECTDLDTAGSVLSFLNRL